MDVDRNVVARQTIATGQLPPQNRFGPMPLVPRNSGGRRRVTLAYSDELYNAAAAEFNDHLADGIEGPQYQYSC